MPKKQVLIIRTNIGPQADLDAIDSYGSLNMGAGFAVFVSEQDANKTTAWPGFRKGM